MPTGSKIQSLFHYLSSSFQEIINGFDYGSTYIRVPFWLSALTGGIGITSALFIPIVAVGLIFTPLYVGAILYERYNIKREEWKRIAEEKRITQENIKLEQSLTLQLKKNMEDDKNIMRSTTGSTRIDREQDAARKIDETFKKKYSLFQEEAKSCEESNKRLLKYLLRDYFEALNKSPIDFHDHEKMKMKIIALVEQYPGYKSHYLDFHENMRTFLTEGDPDSAGLADEFCKHIPNGNMVPPQSSSFQQRANSFYAFIKEKQRLRRVLKEALRFIANFQGAGNVVTLLLKIASATPLIVAGVFVGWPIFALIVGVSALYALTTLANSLFTSSEKKSMKLLAEEVKQAHIKSVLLKRSLKVAKNPKKPIYGKNYTPSVWATHAEENKKNEASEINESETEAKKEGEQEVDAKISGYTRFRMRSDLLVKVVLAAAGAMITTTCLSSFTAMLIPLVPFNLLVGPVAIPFVLYAVYRTVKAQVKAIKEEEDKIEEVAKLKHALLEKYKPKGAGIVNAELEKDEITLLGERLNEYVDFINKLKLVGGEAAARKMSGKYPQEDKIFNSIELLTGIKRKRDDAGNPISNDDRFYNKVASYIKEHSKDSDFKGIQRLRNLFSDNNRTLNPDDPSIKKSAFSYVKKGFGYCKPWLLSIAPYIIVGILLVSMFGVPLVPVCISLGVIFTLALVSNYQTSKREQNIAKLDREKVKCALIDSKFKTASCGKQLDSHLAKKKKQAQQKEVSKEEADIPLGNLNTPRDGNRKCTVTQIYDNTKKKDSDPGYETIPENGATETKNPNPGPKAIPENGATKTENPNPGPKLVVNNGTTKTKNSDPEPEAIPENDATKTEILNPKDEEGNIDAAVYRQRSY
jgi:hypothetical protein